MRNSRHPDPTSPQITFDSYVIPETVQEHRTTSSALPFKGTVIAVGAIASLTFLLGIVTTLQFVGAGSDAPTFRAAASGPVEITGADIGPEVDDLNRVVAASVDQAVTRGTAPDLMTTAASTSRAQLAPLTMSEILIGLSPQQTSGDLTKQDQTKTEEKDIFSRNKLRMLREGVLAGTYSVKTIERNGRQQLCLRMPNANVSQDEAAELIRQAAARGEIELPESLSTEDGNFDADTLIFNLVQTSLLRDGTEEGAEAAREMSRRAFAASKAKTQSDKGGRVYVVERGDSLAYISLQFYGRPSDYNRIFEANRSLLKSPNRIQIGQRLIIPG
ncbi:MAG: LysM peptidoglycan-binding domain-containing protein [Sulfitobacter sp.]